MGGIEGCFQLFLQFLILSQYYLVLLEGAGVVEVLAVVLGLQLVYGALQLGDLRLPVGQLVEHALVSDEQLAVWVRAQLALQLRVLLRQSVDLLVSPDDLCADHAGAGVRGAAVGVPAHAGVLEAGLEFLDFALVCLLLLEVDVPQVFYLCSIVADVSIGI